MADVMKFAKREDVSILALVALTHAQFETIHPFEDGNGRTGRALVQSMLRATGITTEVTVPVSAGLLMDTRKYISALNEYRIGNIEPIIWCFVDATFAALYSGARLRSQIQALQEGWIQKLEGLGPAHSAANQALVHLPALPVISVQALAHRLGVTFNTAALAIDTLATAGILTQSSNSRRNRTWQADEMLNVLDDFASRARRGRA
jgi:Fic family protein